MQTDIKTLIILSPGFPANEGDTTCLPAQQQFVQCLQENFPQLNIIVLAFQYPFVRSAYTWKKIQVISFNGRNKGGLKRLFTWYEVRRKLTSLHRTHSIIGLLSFWCTECALVGNHFAKKHGLKHFTWILGQDARKTNKFARLIKPNAASLVAMSDFLADEFRRNHGVNPKHIIPNGVNPNLYPQDTPARIIDVLGAGSLIRLKQYDVFVDMIADAKKTFPYLNAMICGQGPEESYLRTKIKSLEVDMEVNLTGEKQHSEVLRYMQRSRIFLHPSTYEGFSTVCLEALYAGAHVISFCKPMDEDIPHWHIVKNKEEMLKKLIELLHDDLDHSAVLPFSMNATAKRMMKLFE